MSISISIATPTHNTRFLLDTYKSIQGQDYLEWVLLPNSGIATTDIPQEIRDDSRTVIIDDGFVPVCTNGLPNIGSLKKHVFSKCRGSWIIEMDHDDLLVDGAINKIRITAEDMDSVFIFGNTAAFNDNDNSPRFFGNATAETNYDSVFNWHYRDFNYKGILYKEAICPHLNPFHTSLVLFQPDHPRSFRRTTYEKVGGHDENLNVLDDSDLICRFWSEGKFVHLDECLYLYRVYGDNSWLKRNQDIQNQMHSIRQKYLYQMIIHWAKQNDYTMLDLGGRFNCPEDFTSVDLRGATINCDLNKCWPFADSSIGVLRMFDIIEHLPDKMHTMSEIHRVLRPGGYALISVPSTEGNGAHMAPDHVSFWNEGSFLYYTDRNSAQYIDNTTIRFRPATLFTYYPNDWCKQNRISYVSTILVCLKDGFRLHGEERI
jgi:SAM-dependent methyltransferase